MNSKYDLLKRRFDLMDKLRGVQTITVRIELEYTKE